MFSRKRRAYRLGRPRNQYGLSLIELIVFIVIIGVGLVGITVTYNTVVMHSADPMVRKQALAIAESVLLEIEQQAFTWCDPDDANAMTATSAAECATNNQSNLGGATPNTEARGSNVNPFDNVADYGGIINLPATDILGVAGPAGYLVTVAIANAGGTAQFAPIPAGAMLRITVTVVGRGETITLVGYRARYAPNAAG